MDLPHVLWSEPEPHRRCTCTRVGFSPKTLGRFLIFFVRHVGIDATHCFSCARRLRVLASLHVCSLKIFMNSSPDELVARRARLAAKVTKARRGAGAASVSTAGTISHSASSFRTGLLVSAREEASTLFTSHFSPVRSARRRLARSDRVAERGARPRSPWRLYCHAGRPTARHCTTLVVTKALCIGWRGVCRAVAVCALVCGHSAHL